MATAAPLRAQQWYFVGVDAGGTRIYIDVERLQVSGNSVSTWARVDYAQPQTTPDSAEPAVQVLQQNIYDCFNNTATPLATYFRNSINATVGARGREKIHAIVPNTYGAAELAFACERGRRLTDNGRRAPKHLVPDGFYSEAWREVGTIEEGQRVSVALDRIFPVPAESDKLYFYERRVREPAKQFGRDLVKSSLWVGIANCSAGESGYIGLATFDADGKLLYRGEMEARFMLAPSGSGYRQGVEAVCAQARQSAAADNASVGSGTAWYVDSGYFVTAYHVIDGAGQILLYGPDKEPLPARVAAADAKNDVAILSVDLKARKLRPFSLNKGTATLGSHVFTIGYPHSDVLGVSPKVTSGEVSGNLPPDPTKLLISVPVQGGNSGGPLVNMNGEVVGLVVSKLNADLMRKTTGDLTENTNFALKSRYIDALLEDLPRQPTALPALKPKASSLEDLVATYRDSVYFVLVRSPGKDQQTQK